MEKPAAGVAQNLRFPSRDGKGGDRWSDVGSRPSNFLDGPTLDQKIVEEVQIFSNAKNATYILIQWPC